MMTRQAKELIGEEFLKLCSSRAYRLKKAKAHIILTEVYNPNHSSGKYQILHGKLVNMDHTKWNSNDLAEARRMIEWDSWRNQKVRHALFEV